jgi:hypothetical protein
LDSHSHDKDTATTAAEDFLHFLLDGNVKFTMNAFCTDELLDPAGSHTTPGVMEQRIREFIGRVMTFIDKSFEVIDCSVESDYASVHLDVRWDGLMANTLERRTFSGIARIKLKRSPYEGWDVVQATVPGWNV